MLNNTQKIIIPFLLTFSLYSSISYAQKVEKINVDELKEIIHSEEDKLQVINFWATWCGPCIKELPAFEKAYNKYSDKVDFTMVSLDFPSWLEKKVIPFVEKKEMPQKVVLLDYGKDDAWYDLIDEKWEGAIPVTLILNNAKKQKKIFIGSINEKTLEKAIDSFL